jgi:WhiB family redox-sensing transcriptional regulator
MASTSADRHSWVQAARCVELDRHALTDPDPRGTDSPWLCLRCPVQATCLGWALVTGADQGVLGGVGPEQRRAIRAELLTRLGGRSMAGSPELAEVVRNQTQPRLRSRRNGQARQMGPAR